MDYKGCLMQIR